MEKTCGNCDQLYVGGLPPRMPNGACKLTDYVVPHQWDGEKFTFMRVPLECPRTEGVIKSKKLAPKKEWIIKTLSDFGL